MNIKRIVLVNLFTVAFILISALSAVAQPHPLYGYAEYQNGTPAAEATVDVLNLNTSEHISSIVVSSGDYTFDTSNPTTEWKNGNILLITITQENNEAYSGWTGKTSITLDLSQSYQQIPDITLEPLSPMSQYPPQPPSQPSGTTTGYTNQNYYYITTANDPEDDQIYYWFEWGDNTTTTWLGPYSSGNTCISSHSWNNSGTYDIKVKAKDNHDNESSWSTALTIEIQNKTQPPENQTENLSPTAIFTHTPKLPNIQETVQFTDQSIDKDGNITKWLWDFGDGTISTQQHPTYKYTNNRTYIVTLTAWDNNETTNTTYLQITVSSITSETTNGNETPGLGLTMFLTAIAIFIILRRKKLNK